MAQKSLASIPDELAVILDMMGLAFIEIRATDDLKTCKALANTFHNVPAKIRTGDNFENIKNEIFSAAERSKIRPYIKKLYDHSRSKFEDKK